jgi:hypothetical protein
MFAFYIREKCSLFLEMKLIFSHYRSDNNNVLDKTYIYHYNHKSIKILHSNGHRKDKEKSAVTISVVKFLFLQYKYLLRNKFHISEPYKR